MQLLVEGKAGSAFLKYCTILWRCCIRLYLHIGKRLASWLADQQATVTIHTHTPGAKMEWSRKGRAAQHSATPLWMSPPAM